MALGIPVLMLALLEGTLRWTGFGYPTAFFLADQLDDQAVLLNNPRYAWRFIPPSLARDPWPFTLPARKDPGTIRIFVLGESAAMGDPEPRFGLARVLEALLCQRYPDRRFEVVNAALTAINSHAILSIARECAQREGDLWIVYMGNNEVVGPYGPGTVFARNTPSLPFIHTHLAFKRTRAGQMVNAMSDRLQRGPTRPKEWGGMAMFVDHQVRNDDPRMNRVYQHFERNLLAILESGRQSHVPIILNTIGANLRDCAPFASLNRPGLTSNDHSRWEATYHEGIALQDQGDLAAAATAYGRAIEIDDTHAESHFRLAVCLHAINRFESARQHFHRARDEDVLRFRADSHLNNIIRKCAEQEDNHQVRLFDAEVHLAQLSPDKLPGRKLFFEHVHFTPQGNYQVARGIAEHAAHLLTLDQPNTGKPASSWATEDECWRWLGLTDRNRHSLCSIMLQRMSGPPFTSQFGHAQDLARLEADQQRYRHATRPTQIRRMSQEVAATVKSRPHDADLRTVLADLLDLAGDPAAESQWLEATRRLPNSPTAWCGLGRSRQRLGRPDAATLAYRRCLELFPWHNEARAGLRQTTDF